MDIFTMFPSTYLKAQDLNNQSQIFTIKEVTIDDLADGGQKPVMHFVEAETALVLNKTNSLLVASIYGSETTHWTGKQVELYPEKVTFQGRVVDAIRLRAPRDTPPVVNQSGQSVTSPNGVGQVNQTATTPSTQPSVQDHVNY